MMACEHTRLVNRFIGLCINTKDWPSTLHDTGYAVQLIEQRLRLDGGDEVTPDVVAVSNKYSHALVVDCKSGKNVNLDQEERYGRLTPSILLRFVATHDESRMSHNICYADQEKHHDTLEKHTKFPFITFGHNSLRGSRNFGNKHLDKALCKKISLAGMREPTSYYPFSHLDEDYIIAPSVLRGIVSYLRRRGTARNVSYDTLDATKLLELIHPFHKTIGQNHRRQLTARIQEMLGIFMSNDKFKDCVGSIENGKGTAATLQKLSVVCEEMIMQYAQMRKITEYF